MIRRNYIHRLLLEGPLEGKEADEGRERSSLKYSMQIVGQQRKAKNGVDDKHHRMDGDAIPLDLYEYLVRLAQDREPWRIMTANLLKEDGT